MNETEKQSLLKTLEIIHKRLDRQGSVLDKLIAIQEDRNQHQDALEHIQRQNTRRTQDASNRLKELDERLDAIADWHALLEERLALLEDVWKTNEQQIAIIQRKQEERTD